MCMCTSSAPHLSSGTIACASGQSGSWWKVLYCISATGLDNVSTYEFDRFDGFD